MGIASTNKEGAVEVNVCVIEAVVDSLLVFAIVAARGEPLRILLLRSTCISISIHT